MGCVDGCALRLCHYRERRLLVLQGDIVCKSTEKGGYSVPVHLQIFTRPLVGAYKKGRIRGKEHVLVRILPKHGYII